MKTMEIMQTTTKNSTFFAKSAFRARLFAFAIALLCFATTFICFAPGASALTAAEGAEIAHVEGMPTDLIGTNGVLNRFTNIALYVIGFISVIMLIWGGLRYILSGGDNKKITDAKNTILYAILGLIIAFLAYAIVNFVLNAIGSTASVAPCTDCDTTSALSLTFHS